MRRMALAVAAALLPLVVAVPRTAAKSALEAGYAEADITPPLGGSMPGYFQDRKATGVLDPLHARVLYLRQGKESVALVSCDLIGLDSGTVHRIREAAARKAHPAPKQVWVHATHSHTGGMPPRHFTSDAAEIYPDFYPGVVDPKWIDQLVERTSDAIARAAQDLKPETALTLHEGREPTIAQYRRYLMKDGTVRTNPGRNNPQVVGPAGEIDPRIHTLRFGSTRIMAVIYGVHPDTVGGTLYSADYPHHVIDALRESEGQDWHVVYFNAACGNINHIDVKNLAQKSGPEESKRIGLALAAAVKKSLPSGQPLDVEQLQAKSTTVASRLRRPTASEVAEAEDRIRTGKDPMAFNGLFAPAALILAKTREREQTAEIGALELGSFGLATVPGEYFVELARQVEAGSPFHPTRTIGLTNGGLGYIPHKKGYAEGGYEAGYRSARFEPGTGERWADAADRLLQSMRR